MTTIDESKTAKGFTPAALVPAAFGQPRTLEGVVIHHWGLPGQTHDGVVDFFVNGPGETSAHFVVSAGRITCLVAPEDAAWHCPGKNATHIGIECRPEATAADYATVAELVAWLRDTYDLPLPLSKHRDWYNTACPGVWDLDRINALAGKASITPQSTTATPKESTLSAAEVKQIIAAVQADGAKTRDYIKALAYSGWNDNTGNKHPGFMLVIEENQKRIDAIKSAVTPK